MRLALCRLCTHADRLADTDDRLADTGNPVLYGLFNRLVASRFPTALDRCSIAVEIETDPTEGGIEVPMALRLIDEDGRMLTEWRAMFLAGPAWAGTSRTFLHLTLPWDDKMVFERPGAYRIDVVTELEPGEETVLGGEVLFVVVKCCSWSD